MLYIISLLTFGFGFSMYNILEKCDVGVSIFFFIIAFILFIIAIIVQLVCYYGHSDDIENITQEKEDKKVYKRKAENLLAEVRLYLIDKFPEHELKVFDKITNNTVDMLAVDYPEIKSSDTFKKAVESIIELNSSIYYCEHQINRYKKNIRLRKRTIKLTCLPILPKFEDIEI